MTTTDAYVTNDQLDGLMCSGACPAMLLLDIANAEDANRVRGRAYYSARIHGAELTTRYADGVLTLVATR